MNDTMNNKRCEHCSSIMDDVLSARRKYCDDRCRSKARRERDRDTGTYQVKCKGCGELFNTYHEKRVYCDDGCKTLGNNFFPARSKMIRRVLCKECDKVVETNHSDRKFCSHRCRQRSTDRKKDLRKRNAFDNGDSDLTLERLIAKDNNMCHICKDRCDKEDYVMEGSTFIAGNSYPSIDHVIPLAKGGLHQWSNVKLAHRWCNSVKGSKII